MVIDVGSSFSDVSELPTFDWDLSASLGDGCSLLDSGLIGLSTSGEGWLWDMA